MKRLTVIAALAVFMLGSGCSNLFGPTPRPHVIELTASTEHSTPYDFLVRCTDRAYYDAIDKHGTNQQWVLKQDPDLQEALDLCWDEHERLEEEDEQE